ncbi:MAG: LysE family transporter, partial [Bdellovibrionales bacterium]|nr:LysE family transporter [Bdellovibrionales bacterium]
SISCSAAFYQGFLCNVLNPKLAVFLLSLFTQFVQVEASLLEKGIVAGIFVGESLLWWPILVLILQIPTIQSLFVSFRHILDRISGALLIVLGARVVLRSEP